MSQQPRLATRQQVITAFLRCAVNLYGFVTPRAFLKLFNRFNRDEKLLKAELVARAHDLNQAKQANYIVYQNAIVSRDVPDEQIQRICYYQQGKPYYIPQNTEELLGYQEFHHYEMTPQTEGLRQFLFEKLKMNMFQAEAFIRKWSWLSRTEQSRSEEMELLEEFPEVFEDETTALEFLEHLSDMSNNTRKWANAGYTPHEISEMFRPIA